MIATTPMTESEIEEFFSRLSSKLPEPETELEYSNPFTLLVAVVLSAQATDVGVNKATRRLFADADTAAEMVALGEDAIREHIRTIGLFRTKAKNVFALSQILVRDHDGEVPRDRAALEALPGVGRKTATVVLIRICSDSATAPASLPVRPRAKSKTNWSPGFRRAGCTGRIIG